MGRMLDGVWTTEWYQPDDEGRFVRPETVFRGRVEADGPHPPVSGRYHLYVSLACPWAHRTLIARALLGLEEAITVSVVEPLMLDDGWVFSESLPDRELGCTMLREVYLRADPRYTGRVTVPILWDRAAGTIVNNESREIVRMMATTLAPLGTTGFRLFEPERAAQVDAALDAIYRPINDGVYRTGFSTTQRAYDEAVGELFDALDHWERELGTRRFVVGERPSEADIFLFTTLIRFDVVYHGHFKCNRRRIVDYPNLSRLLRDIYELPGVADTVDLEHCARHYYGSHPSLNPSGIVPTGPASVFRDPARG